VEIKHDEDDKTFLKLILQKLLESKQEGHPINPNSVHQVIYRKYFLHLL